MSLIIIQKCTGENVKNEMLQVVRQNGGAVGKPHPRGTRGRCWKLHRKGKGAGLEVDGYEN